ncbi:MAG: glycosyltransferase [Candidatus Accumulibacter sp.]|nr:glycosyltransferase [Accumulibacter sp.]
MVVLSSLFPHAGAPGAGLFVRERMFRVARRTPLVVVSPRPWFPGQGLIRRFRPGYRPPAARHEVQDGIDVYLPRFFSLPGALRRLDGFFMALGAWFTLRRLRRSFRFNLIDAHFGYPDGYAGTLLARHFGVPCTVTLRGTEMRHSLDRALRPRLERMLRRADRVFSVSASLLRLAAELGMPEGKGRAIGNGVDTAKFFPADRAEARRRWGIAPDAKALVSVGALVERKGFHRVLVCLPELRRRHPGLRYLIVGGASPEGDMEAALRAQAARLGLEECVVFCGAVRPEDLRWALSAADVFALATRNEGWANVFLEAMACGLPVVTTDVGGNREVLRNETLGRLTPFGDAAALTQALDEALSRTWDKQAIIAYAARNGWDGRVEALMEEFHGLLQQGVEQKDAG